MKKIDDLKKKTSRKDRRDKEKNRIKQAFLTDDNSIEIIPAQIDINEKNSKKKRVGAYCRVSTLEEAQAGSFEIQRQHFIEIITQNPDWEIADIYSDEGVSGTNIKKRLGFQRMLQDAEAGKLDMIITKSISRFGRSIVDVSASIHFLKNLTPPVGVYFEQNGLHTLDANNTLTIQLLSLVAEMESQMKSDAVRSGIVWRMERGIYKFPVNSLLGYSRDKYGQIVIVEDEAEIIRYIYNSYIDGQNGSEIANALTKAGMQTVTGNTQWRSGAVLNILRNEKYCGDVIFQKTFIKDYMTHKAVKNTGQRPQYRKKNNHVAIINRDDWNLVQKLLKTKRKRVKTKIPLIKKKFHLSLVKTGCMKGAAYISPEWSEKEIEQFLEVEIKKRRKNSV